MNKDIQKNFVQPLKPTIALTLKDFEFGEFQIGQFRGRSLHRLQKLIFDQLVPRPDKSSLERSNPWPV